MFSGAALIEKDGKEIFSYCCGEAHKGFKIKNTINTRFDTASVTKLFTSVSVLQLVEQKKLKFEDKIFELLSLDYYGEKVTVSKDITIYQLLTHTSGMADDANEEFGEDYDLLWKDKPNYSVHENKDFLPNFIYKEPLFTPGEKCGYNNCAYILLGLIIEKLTSKNYRDYVKENVFDKVDMKDSCFCAMDEVNKNVAEGYFSEYSDDGKFLKFKKNIYSYPPIGTADSGAYTTCRDMMKFMKSLLNFKLLGKEMVSEILKPKAVHTDKDTRKYMMGYGFEFEMFPKTNDIMYITKDGCNKGVAVKFNYYPRENANYIVMANQDCDVWDLSRQVSKIIMRNESYR
jgi:CubicO group peptidase (beta-lactamase class C family)